MSGSPQGSSLNLSGALTWIHGCSSSPCITSSRWSASHLLVCFLSLNSDAAALFPPLLEPPQSVLLLAVPCCDTASWPQRPAPVASKPGEEGEWGLAVGAVGTCSRITQGSGLVTGAPPPLSSVSRPPPSPAHPPPLSLRRSTVRTSPSLHPFLSPSSCPGSPKGSTSFLPGASHLSDCDLGLVGPEEGQESLGG